jgi:hypothetical protein
MKKKGYLLSERFDVLGTHAKSTRLPPVQETFDAKANVNCSFQGSTRMESNIRIRKGNGD